MSLNQNTVQFFFDFDSEVMRDCDSLLSVDFFSFGQTNQDSIQEVSNYQNNEFMYSQPKAPIPTELIQMEYEDDQFSENQIEAERPLKYVKKQYSHLKKQRRPKGSKNPLQAKVGGYWTKNFLQAAKKPHFDYIKDHYSYLLKINPDLKEIQKKNGITMKDFVVLYEITVLDEMWKEFFASKVLYRELMLSRTSPSYRLIYLQFLHVFEKAFIEKKFEGISNIIKKKTTKKYG